MELLLIILQYLFPRDPIRRVWAGLHEWLVSVCEAIEADIERLADSPSLRIAFEARLIEAEDIIRMLIEARAREIAGVRQCRLRQLRTYIPSRAREAGDLLVQLARIGALYEDIERLAKLRAERLLQDFEHNPLCIPETIVGRVSATLAESCPAKGGEGGMRALARMTEGAGFAQQLDRPTRSRPSVAHSEFSKQIHRA